MNQISVLIVFVILINSICCYKFGQVIGRYYDDDSIALAKHKPNIYLSGQSSLQNSKSPKKQQYGQEIKFDEDLKFTNENESDEKEVAERKVSPKFGNVDSQDIRKQLCPNVQIDEVDKYRYDMKAKKCTKIGEKGHCGENMVFYAIEQNEVYGECDCSSSLRPLIYHGPSKKCYFVYEQGYCKRGEWLSFNKRTGVPECTARICKQSEKVFVPLRGTGPCVELFLKNSECEANEVISFPPGELTAKCVKNDLGVRSLAIYRKLQCRPGSYLSYASKCQPPFVW